MVLSTSPAALIHVPLRDAWQYRGIEHWTSAGLCKEIQKQRKWNEFWAGKKAERAQATA
jgi:hypothetical protein